MLVDWFGLSFADSTVATATGAYVSEQQKGGGTVIPALANVRAVCFLAHRMKILLAYKAEDIVIVRAARRTHLEPFRSARPV
jgi:hypothetical protein